MSETNNRTVLKVGRKYIMMCTEVIPKSPPEGKQTKDGPRWYFWVNFIDNLNIAYRCEYKSSSPEQSHFVPKEMHCFRVAFNGRYEDQIEPDTPDDATLGTGVEGVNATNSNPPVATLVIQTQNVPRETTETNVPLNRTKDCGYRLEALQLAVTLMSAAISSGQRQYKFDDVLPETYALASGMESYLCNPDD